QHVLRLPDRDRAHRGSLGVRRPRGLLAPARTAAGAGQEGRSSPCRALAAMSGVTPGPDHAAPHSARSASIGSPEPEPDPKPGPGPDPDPGPDSSSFPASASRRAVQLPHVNPPSPAVTSGCPVSSPDRSDATYVGRRPGGASTASAAVLTPVST